MDPRGKMVLKPRSTNRSDSGVFDDEDWKDDTMPQFSNLTLRGSDLCDEIQTGANCTGNLLSVKQIDKVDDLMNVFFKTHQRVEKRTYSLRKSSSRYKLPMTIRQRFGLTKRCDFFRVGFLGLMIRPLYTLRKTKVKVGIIDLRGSNVEEGSVSSSKEIMTSRNYQSRSDTGLLTKDDQYEWINYVQMESDNMYFAGMNSNVNFHINDWDDLQICIEMDDTLVKRGKHALAIDFLYCIDETDNPNKFDLCVIPPVLVPARQVNMMKHLNSVIAFANSTVTTRQLEIGTKAMITSEDSKSSYESSAKVTSGESSGEPVPRKLKKDF